MLLTALRINTSQHENSQKEGCLQVLDFVSWSIFRNYEYSDSRFMDIEKFEILKNLSNFSKKNFETATKNELFKVLYNKRQNCNKEGGFRETRKVIRTLEIKTRCTIPVHKPL